MESERDCVFIDALWTIHVLGFTKRPVGSIKAAPRVVTSVKRECSNLLLIARLSKTVQMKRRWLFYLFLVLAIFCLSTDGAKAGGGGRGSRVRGGRGRLAGATPVQILIPNRNPQSAIYYGNKDGATIVKASHFELDYMLGRKITFFCMARGYPRPEITWFKDGIELYHHKFFQVHEWPIGNDTIKSKMEIDPATQKDAGYYECQADNQYAVDRRGFRTDYVMISY